MLSYEQVRRTAQVLLQGMGTPAPAAGLVADSLAGANLCGHDSHGVMRLPWYRHFLVEGRADATAQPILASRRGSTAVVDGRHGWGQLAARLAVDTAAELATEHGIGIVTAHDCNHIGRLGEYAEDLAERGLTSLMWCNADPAVAPFGGRERMLGTDPFAAGIPAGPGRPPVILDFATAAVAEGKLRLERFAGRAVAPGLIQDSEGRPSTDPEDFYSGGALLPFGLHKGYGLAVMVELLGGAMSGNHVGFLPSYSWGNGFVLIAIDQGHLIDGEQFAAEISEASDAIRACPPAQGTDRVRLPGDVERDTRERRRQEGILIEESSWEQLVGLGDELGVSIDIDAATGATR